jgi:parallel beta-helix repeat protein
MMERVLYFLKALVTFAILLPTAVAATLSVVEMNGLDSAYAQITTKIIRDDATGGDCASIGRWNAITKTCTLSTDLSGTTILIQSDRITLNGNGHTIRGPPGVYGVILIGRTGVTVENLTVNSFNVGITLFASDGNTLTRNTANNNNNAGIAVDQLGSDDNTFTRNTANNNNAGIYLCSSNNIVILNTANSNGVGISVYCSTDSENNIFAINTANLNRQFGYFDRSSGSGTAGTANTYITNACSDNGSGGSNPTGLCSPRR